MRESVHYLRGDRVGRAPRPSRTYQARRVCASGECGTKLSIYNPERFCSQHTPPLVWPEAAGRRQTKGASARPAAA
jgi:hypothetical protein